MKRVLVTGCKGLVGTALREALAERAHGIDADDFDIGCAQDLARFLADARPDAIIHCAALTNVDKCEDDPVATWEVNVNATAQLATWAHTSRARFVYLSTDYVFDGRDGNYDESAGLSPLGVYAQSKAAGELATRARCRDHIIARTSVPFGPWELPKKDFVRWLRDELGGKRPVRIVRDQISNPTYAPELARMLVSLCDRKEIRGTVHTCGATSLSRYDLALHVCRAFGLDASLVTPILTAELKQPSPRPLNASMSVTHAHHLGLAPLHIDAALHALRARS